MRARIKVLVLKVLLRHDGPMGLGWVIQAVRTIHPEALISDVASVLEELEEQHYVVSNRDEVSQEIAYGLTVKGSLQAKKS